MRYLLTFKKLILLILTYTFIFISSDIKSDENKNELYAIQERGKFGFIDNKGKVIIKPQFDFVWWFSKGLCPVELNKKRYYINNRG